MRAARDALAVGDVAGFMALWTDDGLRDVFFEAGDDFVANSGYYVEAQQYGLGPSSVPVVVGSTATTVAPLFFRLVGVVREFSLVEVDGGTWKIDGAKLTTADVGGATPVDVTFGDSSIRLDSPEITGGHVALRVHNPTTRAHELNILTASPGQDLVTFFEHPEDAPPLPEGRSMPEGFDFVGGVVGIEPGAAVTVVFAQSLPAARYVMFCNNEADPAGEPHSEHGEYVELAIP